MQASVGVGVPSDDPTLTDNHLTKDIQARNLADIVLSGGTNKETQYFTNHLVPDFIGPESWQEIGPEVCISNLHLIFTIYYCQ